MVQVTGNDRAVAALLVFNYGLGYITVRQFLDRAGQPATESFAEHLMSGKKTIATVLNKKSKLGNPRKVNDDLTTRSH